MTDLDALRARVGAATGPDRGLDLALGIALAGWRVGTLVEGRFVASRDGSGDFVEDHEGGINSVRPGSLYTAWTESIDEALALVERVLPGWGCGVQLFPASEVLNPDGAQAFVTNGTAYEGCDHKTAPLAILSALLAALPASTQEMNDG